MKKLKLKEYREIKWKWTQKIKMGYLLNQIKKLQSENGQKCSKSQSLLSFNIDMVKHVNPLLIRKTGKCATGQKLNGRIYFFNPSLIVLFDMKMKRKILYF